MYRNLLSLYLDLYHFNICLSLSLNYKDTLTYASGLAYTQSHYGSLVTSTSSYSCATLM